MLLSILWCGYELQFRGGELTASSIELRHIWLFVLHGREQSRAPLRFKLWTGSILKIVPWFSATLIPGKPFSRRLQKSLSFVYKGLGFLTTPPVPSFPFSRFRFKFLWSACLPMSSIGMDDFVLLISSGSPIPSFGRQGATDSLPEETRANSWRHSPHWMCGLRKAPSWNKFFSSSSSQLKNLAALFPESTGKGEEEALCQNFCERTNGWFPWPIACPRKQCGNKS